METRKELEARIIARASRDHDFRARLRSDPSGTIGQELGVAIPAALSIEVHEETATTAHLVLPLSEGLNERDLQAVAAGAPGDRLGGGEPYVPNNPSPPAPPQPDW